MTEFSAFAQHPDGRALYRQRHVNEDGREVLLYGYSPSRQAPVGAALRREPQMSDLRWHPLRGEWAVYAQARQQRTFMPDAAADPLAPMQPGAPPTEIPFAAFELAVFENRFPALLQHASAPGRCEVVVYGAEPEGSLATLSQDRRVLLLAAWIDRYQAMFQIGLDYVLPFENRGEEAGVTLRHPHGQIYGFGFMPAVQQRAMDAFAAGYDLAGALRNWSDYQIAEAGGVVAFAPPFARFPYEVWLAPRHARRGPWEFSGEEREGFAFLMGEITRRYDTLFRRETPYMFSLQAAPRGDAPFQCTGQFYPLLRSAERIKYLASVEQVTGVFTVDVPPELAAKTLREIA